MNSKSTSVPRPFQNGFACLISLSLLALGPNANATQPNLPGDWPTYGNGPAHTGYFPGTLNGLPFVLKWKAPMGYASYGNVLSQPATGGGQVYIAVGYYSSGISLRALNANTGQEVWTNAQGAVYLSPPTYDSGSVFVQQDNAANTSSYLSSFSAATGNQNWAAPYTSQDYQHMAPVAADGMIFTDTGYYHGLTGFDESSGAQEWFVELGGSSQWAPAYYNGEVYTWLGSFTEWGPISGAANWTLTNGLSGSSSSRTVAIADGRAYFIGSSLYCVNLAGQTNEWTVNGGFNYTPVVANGIVYAISNKFISAFTTNGVFVRQFDPNPGGYESLFGPFIVTDDAILATGEFGTYIFRLSDGSLEQQFSSYSGPPNYLYNSDTISLANNTLYIACGDGNLYAYAPMPTTAITLTNIAVLANGNVQFGFTNIPGATFSVWAATNLTSPRNSWAYLGYVTNNSPGQYQFTDTQTAGDPHRYYRVSSP